MLQSKGPQARPHLEPRALALASCLLFINACSAGEPSDSDSSECEDEDCDGSGGSTAGSGGRRSSGGRTASGGSGSNSGGAPSVGKFVGNITTNDQIDTNGLTFSD